MDGSGTCFLENIALLLLCIDRRNTSTRLPKMQMEFSSTIQNYPRIGELCTTFTAHDAPPRPPAPIFLIIFKRQTKKQKKKKKIFHFPQKEFSPPINAPPKKIPLCQ